MEIGLQFLIFFIIGTTAGLFSGLLGIGGGLIVVPLMVLQFSFMDVPEDHWMLMASATSLAVMVFTLSSGAWAHYRRGMLNKQLLMYLAPGMCLGAVIGRFYLALLPGQILGLMFLAVCLYTAYRLWFHLNGDLPEQAYQYKLKDSFATFFFGSLASSLGLGGGLLLVPYLRRQGILMKQAIAVACITGLLLAMFGAVHAFYVNQSTNLPHTVGLIYWPAVVGIAIGSVITAPKGVHLAHKWSDGRVRKCFVLFLLVICLQMVYQLFF